MGKKVGKSTRKNVSGNCSQNFTDHARQFAADAIKTNSKIIIQQKELGIWLVLILLIELIKFQKIHTRIIHKQLQMSMINKYLKNDIHLQKKDKTLLMTSD